MGRCATRFRRTLVLRRWREVHEQGMVLHRKALDQAVATLTAEQRTTWTELTGDHFGR